MWIYEINPRDLGNASSRAPHHGDCGTTQSWCLRVSAVCDRYHFRKRMVLYCISILHLFLSPFAFPPSVHFLSFRPFPCPSSMPSGCPSYFEFLSRLFPSASQQGKQELINRLIARPENIGEKVS